MLPYLRAGLRPTSERFARRSFAESTPSPRYAVDSFPEEKHNPFSDHDDFANVMSQQIMNRLVDCVNTGKKCRE
jgi:hypothetical protein